MIASSTNKPREIINAPSDTLCKPIPDNFIIKNVIAITRGMLRATTNPGLKSNLNGFLFNPKLIKVANKTIVIASKKTTKIPPAEVNEQSYTPPQKSKKKKLKKVIKKF